jgi:solute carrier family 35 protein F5
MFFGFVGLFIMLMLWPGLVVMHLSGIEPFCLPNKRQFLFLGLNGIIGTVLCELIWLWACFLTSPLQATLALSFINPGCILLNYVSLKIILILRGSVLRDRFALFQLSFS